MPSTAVLSVGGYLAKTWPLHLSPFWGWVTAQRGYRLSIQYGSVNDRKGFEAGLSLTQPTAACIPEASQAASEQRLCGSPWPGGARLGQRLGRIGRVMERL